MSFSASSEIFLLPLSVPLTAADRDWQTEVGSGDGLAGRLSIDGCFLADEANSLLRVFNDLTCLDSINSPIVLFGPSQTGKSLLSRGVAQRLARIRAYRQYQQTIIAAGSHLSPSDLADDEGIAFQGRAICLSAADWSHQLQEAVETNSITEFRERFLSAGTVQIDDLNLLKNSPFSQGQLVILLDLLEEIGVPVFVTSALHPSLLEDFRPDLISRLMGGTVLPVNLPGVAAKRTYLNKRAGQLGLGLSSESVDWLAYQAPLPTFAALEGLLQELSVWCKFSQQELCLTEIKSRFYDTSADSFDGITDLVISTVAEFYDLTSEQLKSPCRRQTTFLARGLALSLIRHLCPLSLTSLGQLFGNRDHSTILSALQTTERRVQTDQTVRSALVELFERLKSKATVQRITLSKTELNVDLMFSDEEL